MSGLQFEPDDYIGELVDDGLSLLPTAFWPVIGVPLNHWPSHPSSPDEDVKANSLLPAMAGACHRESCANRPMRQIGKKHE
jgi:hypothetical protein